MFVVDLKKKDRSEMKEQQGSTEISWWHGGMLGVCGGLVGVGRATEYTLHVETQSQLHSLPVFSGLYVVFMLSIKDMRIRVDYNVYIKRRNEQLKNLLPMMTV